MFEKLVRNVATQEYSQKWSWFKCEICAYLIVCVVSFVALFALFYILNITKIL